jgi:hypothetical protein
MGIAYNSRVVVEGLVLALDAGNLKSYPGTGTTWTDLSGNGNNGTLTNMDGGNLNSANGGSFTFDGSNEYTQLPTTTLLRASATISSWINITDFTTGKASTGRVFIRRTGFNFNNLVAFYNGGYSFETSTNSNPHEIAGRTTGNRIGDGSGFGDNYPAYLKGKISNFKIYNRALTASEIQQNFNATRSRYSI